MAAGTANTELAEQMRTSVLSAIASAAADADAADHGDGGLGGLDQRALRRLAGGVVDLDVLLGAALALELGDVGAGDEGLLAGARQHDHAHRGVGLEVGR